MQVNYLICLFINIYENIKKWFTNVGIPTKSIISQLLLIMDNKKRYHIKSQVQAFHSYSNNQIILFA